ncbi:hypothetical protein RvY_04199 [Ramazzottius varieornatus]|uniref:Lysosomal dipeptide transporter MFSD1 n=1 Tax=Ramazzottius varieornatus TaxID=947166 RepID=A0A1D1UUC1_RAMVA|nr:hypothetical protein RvY_04199 [Ramazzottius varieornatus]
MADQKRWVFLLFSCLTIFGVEWLVDETSILASRFSGTAPDCFQRNGSDTTCLNMNNAEFNALYVAHNWAGTVVALCTGFFVTRYGVYNVSMVTSALLLAGMILFTVGPYCSATSAAFAVMMVGRLVFGCGYWGNVVVSHQVKSHWFFGKELAVAFGLYSGSFRLSSIVTYASIGSIVEKYGMQTTMWIVFAIALSGPVCAVTAGWYYRQYAEQSMDRSLWSTARSHPGTAVALVKQLNRQYWMIALFLLTFYGTVLSVISDFPKFLIEARENTETAAGLISGIIADIAMFSPLIAIITDRYGWRDIQMLTASSLLFLAFLGMDLIPGFNAILFCVLVGLSYAFMSACVWSGVVVTTTPSTVGVAMGLATSLQSFGAGLFMLIGGFILDASSNSLQNKWVNFYVLLTCTVSLSLVAAVTAWYLDRNTVLKPLRSKYSTAIPAVAAEMNEEVNECSPITRDGGRSGISSRSSLPLLILP